MGRKKSHSIIRRAIFVGLGAFFIAVVVSVLSQGLMANLRSVLSAIAVLLVIIFVGIIMDVVGTAVTAADEPVFHAMGARRQKGAMQGAWLVRNADGVANFCNDVVGDVSSAISGALGAGVALRMASVDRSQLWMEILVTASIAGLTVGGKALGKSYAIRKANRVIHTVGRLIASVGIEPGTDKGRKRK